MLLNQPNRLKLRQIFIDNNKNYIFWGKVWCTIKHHNMFWAKFGTTFSLVCMQCMSRTLKDITCACAVCTKFAALIMWTSFFHNNFVMFAYPNPATMVQFTVNNKKLIVKRMFILMSGKMCKSSYTFNKV